MSEFKRLDDVKCVVVTLQMAVPFEDAAEAIKVLEDAAISYGCAEMIDRFAVSNTLEECQQILRKKAIRA